MKKAHRPSKPRQRRALSHVGGAIQSSGGTEEERRVLERALSVRADERVTQTHVHGFHSYPARLHPITARELIAGFSKSRATVLDPFCGSGTVLVEAVLLGRSAIGVDANPLAVELARLKTLVSTGDQVAKLRRATAEVAAHAEARREERAAPIRRYSTAERKAFSPHILLELDSLADGIQKQPDFNVRQSLRLVLSAMLIKLSLKIGDSSEYFGPKRHAGGFAIRFFGTKVEDLIRRSAAFAQQLPQGRVQVEARVGDARILDFCPAQSVDLVVTSPPYAGVYDYFEHHALRLRFLGMSEGSFRSSEIGARRQLQQLTPPAARRCWEEDMSRVLGQFHRVLRSSGVAVVIIADSVIGGTGIFAEELIGRLAKKQGLEVVAQASQVRPYFHQPTRSAFEERPRREYAILLKRAAVSASASAQNVTVYSKRGCETTIGDTSSPSAVATARPRKRRSVAAKRTRD